MVTKCVSLVSSRSRKCIPRTTLAIHAEIFKPQITHTCMTPFNGFTSHITRTKLLFHCRVHVGISTDGDTIAGDYSKKIQEIVRTALDLWKSDPDVKILIFSHWWDILGVISGALSQNGLRNRGNSKFQQDIDDFKVCTS